MHDDPDILPPAFDDPNTHARDAVEAARAAGTLTPDVERALIGAGRAHVRVLAEIDGDAEPRR